MAFTLDCLSKESKRNVFSKFGYEPHQFQAKAHEMMLEKRFIAIAGGARSGKSMLAGAEIAWGLLQPDWRCWCVSSVYELADKEFQWAMEFLSRLEIGGKSILRFARISAAQRGSQSIRFPWGSFCKTKSTEKPSTLLGEELDLIVLGEASQVPRVPWERMLRARLGPRRGKALFVSTPNSDGGLFFDVFQDGERGKDECASLQFTTKDNPYFSKEEWDRAKATLDPLIFAEQYEGRFVSRRGMVFEFPDQMVLKESPEGIGSWVSFVVFYHHNNSYNNPFVALFFAMSPQRVLYLYDEFIESQILVKEAVEKVKYMMEGRRIGFCLSDPQNRVLQDNLRNAGISTTCDRDEEKMDKKALVIRRIQALQNAMKLNAEGKYNMYVTQKCGKVVEELRSVKWRDRTPEEKDMAEPPLPTEKYISSPMAVSQMVSYVRKAFQWQL